uniref:glycine zipper domain-containing protein n=1 Tax=Aeromicrobium tamlense TaxID=375541 RepID=UPI00389923C5
MGVVVGSLVGSVVGSLVGSVVGSLVGSVVGSLVGSVVGSEVGPVVGSLPAVTAIVPSDRSPGPAQVRVDGTVESSAL